MSYDLRILTQLFRPLPLINRPLYLVARAMAWRSKICVSVRFHYVESGRDLDRMVNASATHRAVRHFPSVSPRCLGPELCGNRLESVDRCRHRKCILLQAYSPNIAVKLSDCTGRRRRRGSKPAPEPAGLIQDGTGTTVLQRYWRTEAYTEALNFFANPS